MRPAVRVSEEPQPGSPTHSRFANEWALTAKVGAFLANGSSIPVNRYVVSKYMKIKISYSEWNEALWRVGWGRLLGEAIQIVRIVPQRQSCGCFGSVRGSTRKLRLYSLRSSCTRSAVIKT